MRHIVCDHTGPGREEVDSFIKRLQKTGAEVAWSEIGRDGVIEGINSGDIVIVSTRYFCGWCSPFWIKNEDIIAILDNLKRSGHQVLIADIDRSSVFGDELRKVLEEKYEWF